MSKDLKKPIIILIGAKPKSASNQHPGGQITASLGLLEYANRVRIVIKVIDTTQSSFPVPPFSARFRKGLRRLRELLSLSSKYDVRGCVIFSSSGFSFYERIVLALLCRVLRIKTILFIRSGHFIDEINASKIKSLLAKLFLLVPTIVGAQGENWRRFYEGLGVPAQKITVVRNWLPSDTKLSKVKCSTQKKVRFIFVGWLVKNKGVIELLNACEILINQGFRFELTIVGDGDLSKYVQDLLASGNLGGCVRWVGWKKPQEVHTLLQQHDVFILPSKSEGFPNSMVEAMSAGLPVIVSDVGAVSDSLMNGVNGFLLASTADSEIAHAMSQYIFDPLLIEKHSKMSLYIVKKNHDYEKNCKKIFSFFDI